MEFLYHNADSAEAYYAENMRYFICQQCELEKECKKGADMPVISPLSRYMLKWHSESKNFPVYPLEGTWEDQPTWFLQLLDVITQKLNQLQKSELDNAKLHK